MKSLKPTRLRRLLVVPEAGAVGEDVLVEGEVEVVMLEGGPGVVAVVQ